MLRQHQFEAGQRNQKLHNTDLPLLIGDVGEGDIIREVNGPNYQIITISDIKKVLSEFFK